MVERLLGGETLVQTGGTQVHQAHENGKEHGKGPRDLKKKKKNHDLLSTSEAPWDSASSSVKEEIHNPEPVDG